MFPCSYSPVSPVCRKFTVRENLSVSGEGAGREGGGGGEGEGALRGTQRVFAEYRGERIIVTKGAIEKPPSKKDTRNIRESMLHFWMEIRAHRGESSSPLSLPVSLARLFIFFFLVVKMIRAGSLIHRADSPDRRRVHVCRAREGKSSPRAALSARSASLARLWYYPEYPRLLAGSARNLLSKSRSDGSNVSEWTVSESYCPLKKSNLDGGWRGWCCLTDGHG